MVGNLWFSLLGRLGKVPISGVEPVVLTGEYKLSIHDNIVMIYIGLCRVGYPVLISDILNWILEGVIPYYNAYWLLPEHFKPVKLLLGAFKVKSLPTLAQFGERVEIVAEILQDQNETVQMLKSGVVEKLLTRTINHYKVVATGDFLLLCLGFFKSFFMSHCVFYQADLAVAVSFVMALRLYFQFEDPKSDHTNWVSWFSVYLDTFQKNKVSSYSGETSKLCSKNEARHYLNLSKSNYIEESSVVLSHIAQVASRDRLTEGVSCQFAVPDSEPFLNVTLSESSGKSCEENSGRNGGKSSGKNSGKSSGKMRLSTPKKRCFSRTLVVYPTDKLLEESILPLELDMIINDVSALFHITAEELFREVNKVARMCLES